MTGFGISISEEVERDLRKAYRESLSRLEREGLEYAEEYHVKFGLPSEDTPYFSSENDRFSEFHDYISHLSGSQEAEISLIARDLDGKQVERSYPVEVDMRLPEQHLTEFYGALDQEFDMGRVGASCVGIAEDPVEAYENSSLIVSLLGSSGSRENVYLNMECHPQNLETLQVEADSPGDLETVYRLMDERAVYYSEPVLFGQKDTEWFVCQDGHRDVLEMR